MQVGSKIETLFKGTVLSMSHCGTGFVIGRLHEEDEYWRNDGNVIVYFDDGFDWVRLGDTIGSEDEYIDFKDWGNDVYLSGDGSRVAVFEKRRINDVVSGKVRVYKFKNDNSKQVGNDLEALFENGMGYQHLLQRMVWHSHSIVGRVLLMIRMLELESLYMITTMIRRSEFRDMILLLVKKVTPKLTVT